MTWAFVIAWSAWICTMTLAFAVGLSWLWPLAFFILTFIIAGRRTKEAK